MARRPVRLIAPALALAVMIALIVAGSHEANLDNPEAPALASVAAAKGGTPLSTPVSVAEPPPASVAIDKPQRQRVRPAPEYTFIWPATGSISQGMTPGHPVGIDIRANIGDPLRAVRAGRVTFAGGNPCCVYGYYVTVEHDDGWTSLYAHLSTVSVVAGDRIGQGDLLGLAGDTGKADGAHLHFELLSSGGRVNPLSYLEPRRYYVPVYEPPRIEATDVVPARPTATAVDQVIAAAARWMAGQGEGGYVVNRGSCFAFATGPNWSVSCAAIPPACDGIGECERLLEACVVGPSLLVEATCSGY